MGAKTLLYLEETNGGDKDAQLFVSYDGRAGFRVYFTRAPPGQDSTVPVSRFAFKTLNRLLLFLKTILDKDSVLTTSFYTIAHYDEMTNFNDLWAETGPNTELATYDYPRVGLKTLRKNVKLLQKMRTEEAFTWSAYGDDDDDDEWGSDEE